MNTCGDCPRRPAAAALLAGARKGVCAGPLRWKAPRALERRRIDVHRRERAHATGPLARRVQRFARTTHSRPREVSEGSTRRGYRKPTKLRCFTPPRAKAHERGSRSARSRHRAVKRGAVGGRMTARWSGVARGNASARRVRGPTGDLEVERRRVSHGARRQSPKVVFRHGCSWRETSVVETDSRHLDAVTEGWP